LLKYRKSTWYLVRLLSYVVKYGRQALKDRNLFKSSHGPKPGDTVQLTPVKANRAAAVKRSTTSDWYLYGSRGPFKTLHTTTLPALHDQPYPQNGDLSKQPIGKDERTCVIDEQTWTDAVQNVMQSRQTVNRLSCLQCGQVERRRLPSLSIWLDPLTIRDKHRYWDPL
jgi:hypothetical protein